MAWKTFEEHRSMEKLFMMFSAWKIVRVYRCAMNDKQERVGPMLRRTERAFFGPSLPEVVDVVVWTAQSVG